MRSASGISRFGAFLSCLALTGCTTLASGVAVAPPGIDRSAFRACLLDRGFYAAPALTGTARQDWLLLHPGTADMPTPDRRAVLEESDGAFLARAAATIVGGLMPALEFDAGASAPSGVDVPYVKLAGSGHAGLLDWRLNRFLDCYVGPITADDDEEGRLLRAHILLTLLAQFGAELLISHANSRQVAQAEMLLDHIRDAERELRSASAVMAGPAGRIAIPDTTMTAQPALRWRSYVTRLLRLLQVAIDDERIDAGQSIERATNLVAALRGPATGFLPLLKDGLAGAITAQETRFYGDAYLRDARETLAMARHATTVDGPGFTYDIAAFRQGWRNWDGELAHACTLLASIAKKDDIGCLPTLSAGNPA